jgi:hypothetical protein
MARIRSVHPGLFTDEAFVSLSMAARMLLIGIWTEADDHGVFEWKPVSLKMRIFPADHAEVTILLAELETHDLVKRFTCDTRQFGIVRNFCKYQRPKNPSYRHPFTEEYHYYVGLTKSPNGVLPQSSGSPTENRPQMEEEGGRGEKEEEKERKQKRASARRYRFDGGIIKLTEPSFENWASSFQNLDLRAELTARDAWLGSERASDKDRLNWFVSTSKYLANRNAEARARASPQPQTVDPRL